MKQIEDERIGFHLQHESSVHPPDREHSMMFRTPLTAAALLLAAASHLAPGLAAQSRRPLEIEDYYRLKSVGSPALSPDGSRVAFVVTSVLEDENGHHSEIWIADADGTREPTRLTSPSFSASNPAWTPDGSRLYFTSRRPAPAGEPAGGPWFLQMDGAPGEAFRIEGLDGSPAFSPDGRWIVFTRPVLPSGDRPEPTYDSDFERRTAGRFDGRIYDWMNYRFDRRGYLADPRDPWTTPSREVFLLPAAGGAPRQLTELGVDASGLAWSPDGGRIAFTADAHQRDEHSYERADLWVVVLAAVRPAGPAATPEASVTRLTDDEYNYSGPAWSADGREILVRGNEGLDVIIREGRDRGAPSDLFVFDAGTGERTRNLTEDWDLIPRGPAWSSDGAHVYFSGGIRGNTHLFRVQASGGAVEQVTQGDRRLGGFSFSDDFSRMAFTATDPVRPADIWAAETSGAGERRVSDANGALLAELELPAPDRLLFRNEDCTEVEGWMLPARGYRGEPSATQPPQRATQPQERAVQPHRRAATP